MIKAFIGYILGAASVVLFTVYLAQNIKLVCDVKLKESNLTRPCEISSTVVLGVQI